jgi:hypothetical protein
VFEVNADGVENAQLSIRAQAGETGRRLRRLVEDAADFGANVMTGLAPRRSGKLASRIGSTDADFRPGGPGGGGVYEASFGVSDQPGPERDLPFWVYHGTGIFAEELGLEVSSVATGSLISDIPGEAVDHVIRSTSGNEMRFRGDFGYIVTPYVLGQRPQKEWVDEAHDAASDYVRTRLTMFH